MSCAQPVLERFESVFFPGLRFVPAALISEHRVADIDDGRPKYTGYIRSQAAFMSRVLFPRRFRSGRA
jgi:hypothetical protein